MRLHEQSLYQERYGAIRRRPTAVRRPRRSAAPSIMNPETISAQLAGSGMVPTRSGIGSDENCPPALARKLFKLTVGALGQGWSYRTECGREIGIHNVREVEEIGREHDLVASPGGAAEVRRAAFLPPTIVLVKAIDSRFDPAA